MEPPKLRFLHSGDTLIHSKLAHFRQLLTIELIHSLEPELPAGLKTRPDGTVLDGHHRLKVLLERGQEVNGLPREIIEKK